MLLCVYVLCMYVCVVVCVCVLYVCVCVVCVVLCVCVCVHLFVHSGWSESPIQGSGCHPHTGTDVLPLRQGLFMGTFLFMRLVPSV